MAPALRRAVVWLLCALVFTVPLEDLVQVEGVGRISRVLGLVTAPLALTALGLEGRWRRLRDTHLLAAAFALWLALSVSWSLDPSEGLISAFTMAQLLVLLVLIWQFVDDGPAHRRLLGAYVLGAAVACVVVLQTRAAGVGTYDVGRFSPPNVNPNDLGFALALSVPMAWHLANTTQRRLTAVAAWLYLPLAALTIVLTGSRGGVVVLAVAGLVLPLSALRNRTQRRALLSACAVLAVAIVMVVPPPTLERLATTAGEIESGTLNYRRDIWAASATLIEQQPLFGVGVGATKPGVARQTGMEYGAHNAFISVGVEMGAVGLAMFLLLLLSVAIRAATQRGSGRLFSVVLLLTLVVGFLPAHRELRKGTWLVIAMVLSEEAIAGTRASARDGPVPAEPPGLVLS